MKLPAAYWKFRIYLIAKNPKHLPDCEATFKKCFPNLKGAELYKEMFLCLKAVSELSELVGSENLKKWAQEK